MYQRDYILKMIEMMGQMLAAFFGLIKRKQLDEAADTIDDMFNNLLKEDAAFFHTIKKEELTAKLLEEHNYTNSHLEVLAELFYAEATLRKAQKKRDMSMECFEKALMLFEYIEKELKVFSMDRQDKIGSIRKELSEK